MTKQVRIENADTSNHKVRVFIEHRDANGEWVRSPNDAPVELDHPTAMHAGWIWRDQRLVVEEASS